MIISRYTLTLSVSLSLSLFLLYVRCGLFKSSVINHHIMMYIVVLCHGGHTHTQVATRYLTFLSNVCAC